MCDEVRIEKAVVLLSGGLDSSTLLHYVKKTLGVEQVYALSMIYGQKHVREIEMARWQAAAVGVVEHRCVDISFMRDMLMGSSALIDPDVETALSDFIIKAKKMK